MDKIGDTVSTILDWVDSGREVAIATITNAIGSSPRPIGSQMVIDSHGRFQGSVSGGCVESTVIKEAGQVIKTGSPKTLFFSAENADQSWEVGLACGGQMEVYIAPVIPILKIFREIKRLKDQKIPCGYIHRIESDEYTMLVKNYQKAIEAVPKAIRQSVTKNWNSDDSMLIKADGQRYFWSQYCPVPELIIVGAVHIAQPLVAIAETVGYQTSIIDPRQAFATQERFPNTNLRLEYPDDVLKNHAIHSSTAIVTLSHDPKIDDPALELAVKSNAFYIGALGSRKTHAARLERLSSAGFTEVELNRIHGPVGLKIGGKSIQEIAVSIMAQIVEQKNNRF